MQEDRTLLPSEGRIRTLRSMERDIDDSMLLAGAAEKTTDARDHDELHAASIVVLTKTADHHYVRRWLDELIRRVREEEDCG